MKRGASNLRALPEWRSPNNKDRDIMPWSIERIDDVLTKAVQPNLLIENRLWAINTLRRCVRQASSQELATLRSNSRLLGTLHFLYEISDPTACGARLQEYVLLIQLSLIGADPRFDERAIMDPVLSHEMVQALQHRFSVSLRRTAGMLIRRISEMPHVASALVMDNVMLESLLSVLESGSGIARSHSSVAHEDARLIDNVANAFVNLSGHPRLHFQLARCRRLLYFVAESLLSAFRVPRAAEVAETMATVYNASTLDAPPDTHRTVGSQWSATPRGLGTTNAVPSAESVLAQPTTDAWHLLMESSQARALQRPRKESSIALQTMNISQILPCMMILANLVSFPENRAEIQRLVPDLMLILGLCEAQEVSQELRDAATFAIDMLHDDNCGLETALVTHLRDSHETSTFYHSHADPMISGVY